MSSDNKSQHKRQRIISFLQLVEVEPLIFIFSFGGAFFGVVSQALVYRKTCLYQHSVDICDNLLTNGSDYLEGVQKDASRWQFYIRLAWMVPTLAVLAFFGSWSDKISRKAPMVVVFIGCIIATICELVCAIFIDSHPGFLLIGNVVYGITGGFPVFYVSIFSYLPEVVSAESRTTRISIVYAVQTLSIAVAAACAGFAVDDLGFIFCYLFILFCYVLSLVYAMIRIKDIKPEDRPGTDKPEDVSLSDRSCQGKFATICSASHFKASFLVTFKKREGEERMCIILNTAICFTILVTSVGPIFYLYVMNAPISFTNSLYGIYSGYSSLVYFSSQMIVTPVLKNYARLSDYLLLLVAISSDIISRVWMGVCDTAWMIFLGPIFGYMWPNSIIFVRSILTAIVPADELGQINAVIAWLDCLAAICGSMLFGEFIYPATVDIYPGLVMQISAIMGIVPLGLTIWLYVIYRRQTKHEKLEEEQVSDPRSEFIAAGQINEMIEAMHNPDEHTFQY